MMSPLSVRNSGDFRLCRSQQGSRVRRNKSRPQGSYIIWVIQPSFPHATSSTRNPPAPFTPYQKFVVGLLAFLQFAVILDFMIMSPLGALIMPALDITPKQFGLVVSAYAFSAGVSGFLTAGFADRFDRKKLLLFFYARLHAAARCGAAWRRPSSCCWRRASSPACSAA